MLPRGEQRGNHKWGFPYRTRRFYFNSSRTKRVVEGADPYRGSDGIAVSFVGRGLVPAVSLVEGIAAGGKILR